VCASCEEYITYTKNYPSKKEDVSLWPNFIQCLCPICPREPSNPTTSACEFYGRALVRGRPLHGPCRLRRLTCQKGVRVLEYAELEPVAPHSPHAPPPMVSLALESQWKCGGFKDVCCEQLKGLKGGLRRINKLDTSR
jgi:hypothetical protein